jgi:hypothetical protein
MCLCPFNRFENCFLHDVSDLHQHFIRRTPRLCATMALYTASVKRIIHSGWLYKESSGLFKRWHRRWFVLTDSTLLYYSDERENMRGDEIDIAVSEDCSLPPLKGKNHVMQIRVTIAMQRDQRSQFVLASDTADELLMWKKRISEVRIRANRTFSIVLIKYCLINF